MTGTRRKGGGADPVAMPAMIAMVADGRAMSICASVILANMVHEAGVEALPDYRRRGFGVQAVAGWARAAQASGATPFYIICHYFRQRRILTAGRTTGL